MAEVAKKINDENYFINTKVKVKRKHKNNLTILHTKEQPMKVGLQEEILALDSINLLSPLLKDKTTKNNILWATDAYKNMGIGYQRDSEIIVDLISGVQSGVIKNRARKEMEAQAKRTRQHAEVFTPMWVCNMMNNYADEVWFGKPDIFNKDGVPTSHIDFPENHTWQEYIDSRRLEITCGEAPYLVSRYDAITGESVQIKDRIGVLDRKLRVVNENTTTENEWFKWTTRAFEATYGYEYQGDNLLIARVNMLMTFEEYLYDRWHRKPTQKEYQHIANIIVWNIWQMDGLTGCVPCCDKECDYQQLNLFGMIDNQTEHEKIPCKIYDWRSNCSLEFLSMSGGK